MRIEAYGVRGLTSRPWRKTFASVESMLKWAERNDAEIYAHREAE